MRSGASACGDDPVDPGTQSFDPAFAVETIDAVLDALAASEVPVMLSQVHCRTAPQPSRTPRIDRPICSGVKGFLRTGTSASSLPCRIVTLGV